MKFRQYIIVLLAFILLIGLFEANAADCEYCSGASGWSGGDPGAGEPPNCTMYASSRTLGTCEPGGTGTCSESSKATLHYKMWHSEVPAAEEAVCLAVFAIKFLWCDGDEVCEWEATADYAQCLEDNTICVLDSDEYSSYMTGC